MIRTWTLLCLITALAACGQYREPTVNCFAFLAPAPGITDCEFEPLGELRPMEAVGA